jgi:purine-binding chemotaxis protein CheW
VKNPIESLQDYFDELLLPQEPELPVQSPVISRSVAPHGATVTKPATKTRPRYAEPEPDQKEKLQKLLSSARANIQVAPVVKVEVAPVETKTKFVADPTEIQEWVIETAAPIVAAPAAEVSAVTTSETQTFQMPGMEWLPNGRPQWAQSRFDVLLFKVSGLTLAVPLISLGQIQPLTDELTPLFGQADWFMGLQPTAQGKIRTVNTAKFVMPERYDENFVKSAKYVVSINGVPWGLAVDSVNQPISLMPEDVKWRTDRSKRPWLAGTIKEHMCALLDIPMIGQMLMNADKNAMKSGA